MRAAKVLAVLAIAALAIGSFSAVALAGKSLKLKAGVGFDATFDKSGLVIAQVSLFQLGREWKPCFERRSMRLQVVNSNGVVLTTLDGSTGPPHATEPHGIWTLSGQLPTTLPAGTNYLRVKVKKKTAGGNLCLAAFSKKDAIPAV